MKLYNYHCEKCSHTFEAFVKTHDQQVPCEKCGGETEKRLTMPAFILRGVGVVNAGTFPKSSDGPKLDQDLLRLSDRELNIECGLDPDMD